MSPSNGSRSRWRPGCTSCAASTRPGSATHRRPAGCRFAALGSDAHTLCGFRAGIRRSGPEPRFRVAPVAPARARCTRGVRSHAGGAAMKPLPRRSPPGRSNACSARASRADARCLAESLVQTSLWASIRTASRAPRTTNRPPTVRSTGAADRGHAQRPGHRAGGGRSRPGIVVAHRANRIAMEIAREQGAGAVGVSDSPPSHCGAVGSTPAVPPPREGLIGFRLHALRQDRRAARRAPALLGTNPIGMAFPRGFGAGLPGHGDHLDPVEP